MASTEAFNGMFAVTYTGGNITIAPNTSNLLIGRNATETMTYTAGTGTNPVPVGAALTGTTTAAKGVKAGFTYVAALEQGTKYIGILVQDTTSKQYYVLTIKDTGSTFGGTTSTNTLIVQNTIGWDLLGTTGTPACFMAGTAIRTPSGDVAVDTLKAGDLVTLSDGRTAPICWLGRQTISMVFADRLRVLPIRVKAGALGENLPARDLLLSACHALLVDNVLIQAGALVNGVSIIREEDVPAVFTYYHVEVADHSLILAENTPAETFVDNVDRLGFDNWAEHQALVGDTAITEMEYPRAKAARQVPAAIRARLNARAGSLAEVQRAA
ncbi:hypothetical protein GCM10010909_23990 [Acidocella aquatica]|uniref:Hedgehog/Intein (Hint) domain-containing protein n=1 Tax=Acidocella aquatica TaxID=1922313 RepID=A0ABQ6A7V2_9PROT|nr:Hint domain-containing protein [Acidocella aquatica]GLR67718.1 hypothetical protein GCM10010909_23990 [Acidocella aquatica]